MAQGITIKGKTASGQNVEVRVDSNGVIQFGGESVDLLEQIRGFDIPPYDEIELGYTGDNLTTVVYKLATVTVATLTLAYTGDKLTNVSVS